MQGEKQQKQVLQGGVAVLHERNSNPGGKETPCEGGNICKGVHGHGGIQQALVLRAVCVHATETKALDLAGRSRSLCISDSNVETSKQIRNMCSLGREGREKQPGFEAKERKYKVENSFIFFHLTHLQPCLCYSGSQQEIAMIPLPQPLLPTPH